MALDRKDKIEIPSKDAVKSEDSKTSATATGTHRPAVGGHIGYQCESVYSGHCIHCTESGWSLHDHVTDTGTRAVLSEYGVQTPALICYHVHRNPKLGCRVLANIGYLAGPAFLAE